MLLAEPIFTDLDTKFDENEISRLDYLYDMVELGYPSSDFVS